MKRYFLLMWSIFDPFYSKLTRLDHIEKGTGDQTLIRIRLTRYRGRTITLSDGTVIHKNDLLFKIHLHNVKLLNQIQSQSEIRKALTIYKGVQESLPFIAEHLQLHDYSNKIKGIIGITMLHKGGKKLLFERFPIRNPYYKLFKQVAHSFIYLLSTNKILQRKYPSPMYLLMSKDYLFHKYRNIH